VGNACDDRELNGRLCSERGEMGDGSGFAYVEELVESASPEELLPLWSGWRIAGRRRDCEARSAAGFEAWGLEGTGLRLMDEVFEATDVGISRTMGMLGRLLRSNGVGWRPSTGDSACSSDSDTSATEWRLE
jgi:hypothetical protein